MRHLVLSPVSMLNYRVFTKGNSQDREETPKQKEAEKLEFDAWLSPNNSAVSRVDVPSKLHEDQTDPIRPMTGKNEMEQVKTLEDLATSLNITGTAAGHYETSGSNTVGGPMEVLHWDFRKKVLIEEEEAQQRSRSRTGRHVAWMVF